MVYGRSKVVPPPQTPFEEFMATASEKMTASRLQFVPRTVNGTGHTDPSEFCATSI